MGWMGSTGEACSSRHPPSSSNSDNFHSSTYQKKTRAVVTFLLLFNNMVPISLYVTVEMVNYVQAFFIDQDLEVRCAALQPNHHPIPHSPPTHQCHATHTRAQMYDPASETPAMARTSNMNGDLGSVRWDETHLGDRLGCCGVDRSAEDC